MIANSHIVSSENRSIELWNKFLTVEIAAKRIQKGVFKPVQHYLSHIPYMIRKHGVLKAYSGRSMERTIGLYKKLIKSKVDSGTNAGNILQRFAFYNHINILGVDVEKELNLMTPRAYKTDTFVSLDAEDSESPQLWSSPIGYFGVSKLPCQVTASKLHTALTSFYRRTCGRQSSFPAQDISLRIAGRCWFQDHVYSSRLYAAHINEHRRGNNYIKFDVPCIL